MHRFVGLFVDWLVVSVYRVYGAPVLLGDLESLVESARFLLLLSKLYQQQNRYEDRLSYMIKAKEVQDRCVLRLADC